MNKAFDITDIDVTQLLPDEFISSLSERLRTWECRVLAKGGHEAGQYQTHLRSIFSALRDDIARWPDNLLIAALHYDPPEERALDVLVERHWKHLFARCRMLTFDTERAADLAQETWHRVLRRRHSLKPEGNFAAYVSTVATNLWRDRQRTGPMASDHLAALDGLVKNDDGETVALADMVPDLNMLDTSDRTLLLIDINRALEQLTPHLREILIARFITGESCTEIGRRYNRTAQAVSSWVREAIRIMKIQLEEQGTPQKPASAS